LRSADLDFPSSGLAVTLRTAPGAITPDGPATAGAAPNEDHPMEKPTVPFFVRFLESQETLQVRTDVKAGGGPPYVTMKYPSDDDEAPTS
jgi:hypothetical protein